MRILFIGDVVGRPGRLAVKSALPGLVDRFKPDLIIANGENAAGGVGLTPETAMELLDAGINVLTLGNHTWDQKSLIPFLEKEPRLIRPHNFPPGLPGRGWLAVPTQKMPVIVVNLMGRVFFPTFQEDPFRAMDSLLPSFKSISPVIIVDFHAEATSEKQALAWYLDGKVSAILGTHTHVQTADARILPAGTGFISDVGMTGAYNSIIGFKPEDVIERFLYQKPQRLKVADGPTVISGVYLQVDTSTGNCTYIEPINEKLDINVE